MVDLHGQYAAISEDIHKAMQGVIDATSFIKGPELGRFEADLASYMDVPTVVACGNGTDALQVALMALELEPGDEIITTPFTFISTIEVIRLLGLRPILVDVEPDSFNLDPNGLEAAISPKTRAIIPVHLFGQCAHMEPILEIAQKHHLYVVEDNAQAIGADYRFRNGSSMKAGSIGHIGTTSFFPSKNLGAFGDGGALFTRDESLGRRLRALVNHGMKERYYYDFVGVNSRLDTLQAAILGVKLKHLDAYRSARQAAAASYDEGLKDIPAIELPFRSDFSTHVFHQYTLKTDPAKRDALKAHLQKHQIPSAIYYPLPLHLQRAYLDLGYEKGDLPVSEELSTRVLSLPMHTELDSEQLDYIVHSIRSFFSTAL